MLAIIIYVILLLGAVVSLLNGVSIDANALSAMHQIYGALWYVCAAVCLSGAGIIAALRDLKPRRKASDAVHDAADMTDATGATGADR